MGEIQSQPFQLSFNASLRVDFQGSRVTSDTGLILVRELDERLGFGELIEEHLRDPRGTNTRLPLADLLRQSVYSRLAGYEDMNDAERLGHDPTFRLIGSEKVWDRGVALTSRLQSFETELLAGENGVQRSKRRKGRERKWANSNGGSKALCSIGVLRCHYLAQRARLPRTVCWAGLDQ